MQIGKHLNRSLTPAQRVALALDALQADTLIPSGGARLDTAATILEGAASSGMRSQQAAVGACLVQAQRWRTLAAAPHAACPLCHPMQ